MPGPTGCGELGELLLHRRYGMDVAYSLLRFSTPEQAKGDSRRRQEGGAREWCKRNDAHLDTSLWMFAPGVSAYRGKHRSNPDRHALAAFLRQVEEGKVPRGSYLIIESLDRLTREDIQPALLLVLGLLQAGVRIVQLTPSERVYDDRSDASDIMLMVVELMRGHSESKVKSQRLTEAWSNKKQVARESGDVQTTKTPGWLEVVGREKVGKHMKGGTFRIIPERVRVVKLVFTLACSGYGLSLIVKRLTGDGIKPWGRGKLWSKAYVHKIISRRAVVGEYQPLKNGKPDGEPIVNYYPTVIDEDTWLKAQAALSSRKDKQGRVGKKVASLFSGLLWDGRTQSKLLITWQNKKSKNNRRRVLVSADSMEGRTASVSFPYPVFEEAMLSCLRELNPAEVIGEEPEGESTALALELVGVEQRLKTLEEELTGEGSEVPTLIRAVKVLEVKRQDLQQRLAVARQREANPRSVAWAEAKGLLDVAHDEESRLRLRSLLRGIIESVWMVVVPRRSHRVAAVQVYFTGGGRRSYWIDYWSAGYCRSGGWRVRSYRSEYAVDPIGESDLRDLDEAWGVEGSLRNMTDEQLRLLVGGGLDKQVLSE
jgi:DNA invertase Pin-like site-specific DNA recombinase